MYDDVTFESAPVPSVVRSKVLSCRTIGTPSCRAGDVDLHVVGSTADAGLDRGQRVLGSDARVPAVRHHVGHCVRPVGRVTCSGPRVMTTTSSNDAVAPLATKPSPPSDERCSAAVRSTGWPS
jgi:hypothetical protein